MSRIERKRNNVTLDIKYGSVNKSRRQNWMSYFRSSRINSYKVFVECKLNEGLYDHDIQTTNHYKYIKSVSMIPSKPFQSFKECKSSPPFIFIFGTSMIKTVTIVIKLDIFWYDHLSGSWNCVENQNTLTLKHDIDSGAPFKEEHITHTFMPGSF